MRKKLKCFINNRKKTRLNRLEYKTLNIRIK